VASYREGMSTYARATIVARSRPDLVGRSSIDASELRARAARYRQLADVLYDPRVVTEVQACARELDTEAAWIERQNAFGARMMMQRYGIGG
jgi:hypothetical protein